MSKIDEIYRKFNDELEFPDVIKDDINDETFVHLSMPVDNTEVNMLFISDNDKDAMEAIKFRAYDIVELDESKRAGALKLVAELNSEYKLLKFVVDSDNAISAMYDITMANDNIGASSVELFARATSIIKDAYPRMMKLKWS